MAQTVVKISDDLDALTTFFDYLVERWSIEATDRSRRHSR